MLGAGQRSHRVRFERRVRGGDDGAGNELPAVWTLLVTCWAGFKPQFGREQLLATLLVFRVLYFVIPFGTAISIMGARELWMNVVMPWQQRRRDNGNMPPQVVTPMPSPPPSAATPVPQRVTRMKSRR